MPLHSVDFRELAATERGDAVALVGATTLAQTAWDVLSDSALLDAARAEFRAAG